MSIRYEEFDGINGYKTVENAKKAVEKKLANVERTVRVTIVVNPEGRYVPVVVVGNGPNSSEDFHLIHQGLCIIG